MTVEIDLKKLAALAQVQCTYEEIASVFGCSVRTIERRAKKDKEFREIIEGGKGVGRVSIRRQQFRLMNAGNPTMAIWLGKQYLGQRNDVDPYSGDDDTPAGRIVFNVAPPKSEVRVTRGKQAAVAETQ